MGTTDEECKHGIYPASSCTICNGKDKAYQEELKRASEHNVFRMEAKFPSTCMECANPIKVGQRMVLVRSETPLPKYHEECYD